MLVFAVLAVAVIGSWARPQGDVEVLEYEMDNIGIGGYKFKLVKQSAFRKLQSKLEACSDKNLIFLQLQAKRRHYTHRRGRCPECRHRE